MPYQMLNLIARLKTPFTLAKYLNSDHAHRARFSILATNKEVIMILTEIEKMSTIERLQAMEKLWDSLCNKEEIESPLFYMSCERRLTSLIICAAF